jgi:hypothetical protein
MEGTGRVFQGTTPANKAVKLAARKPGSETRGPQTRQPNSWPANQAVKLAGRERSFSMLYGPDSVLELYTICGPKCPNFNKIKIQMHVKQLLVYRCFIFQLNKVEICFNDIHICVCLRKNRGTNNISSA